MIESFRHKGLKKFFEDDDRSKLRPDQVRRIGILLAAIDVANAIDELDRPSFALHPLKGALKGRWSVLVNGNWRIVFRFENGGAHEVELMDYH